MFFVNNFLAGLGIIAGLALYADRKTFRSAIYGGLIGSAIGVALGVGNSAAFISILCCISLYPYFGSTRLASIAGAAISAIGHVLLIKILGIFGFIPLSTAFCLTTIGILWYNKKMKAIQ